MAAHESELSLRPVAEEREINANIGVLARLSMGLAAILAGRWIRNATPSRSRETAHRAGDVHSRLAAGPPGGNIARLVLVVLGRAACADALVRSPPAVDSPLAGGWRPPAS